MLKETHNHIVQLLFRTLRHLLDYQTCSKRHPVQGEKRVNRKLHRTELTLSITALSKMF